MVFKIMKKPYLINFGLILSLTSGLGLGFSFVEAQANPLSAPNLIAQADLVNYDDPVMAIATKYPSNMDISPICSGEGCGYFFNFKPQKNGLDAAQLTINLMRGETTAAETEKFLTQPGGLLESNGWKPNKSQIPAQLLNYSWVKKVIPFAAADKMKGYILVGEIHGQGVRVTLFYPDKMYNTYGQSAKIILDNLKFKADKLPLKPTNE